MQKHKKLSAKILSLILAATMAFTTLPATVFATEGDAPAQEQCSCDVLCTEDNTNTDCTVCKAEDADLTACKGSAPTAIAPFAEENGGLQNVYIDGAGWNDNNGEGYYDGDDTFDGKTQKEPVQSFAKAAELVAPGGTIWCISTNVVTDTQTWDLSSKPGVTIKQAGTSGDIMVTVMGSGNLTIKGIVLDGENKQSGSALVNVQGSGQLIMDSGSVIENNNTTHSYGAGVFVKDTAQLTMKGDAAIRNNHAPGGQSMGGGITVYPEATVNITENATVTGNTSGMDGAGIYVFGTMNMSGGTISGNTAGDTGGGIFINKSATANFTGGSVKENVANASSNAGAGNDIYSNQCENWTISGDWKPSEGILLNGAAYLTISSALQYPIALEQIRKADNAFIGSVVAKGTDSYHLTEADVLKFSCKNPQIGFELDGTNNQIKLVKIAYAGTQATAPTATRTHDTVTLNAQTIAGETVEYGIEKGNNGTITWQDSATFSSLAANTDYKFFARVKETDTHQAGATSASTTIKTKNAPTTVSGTVKDSSGAAVSGATVTLTPSKSEIKTTTGADGKYTLNTVPEDTYRLVVENGTTTITDKIDVAGTPISKDMQFLAGNKNTVVESKPGTPEVAVGGMNDLLDSSNIGATLTEPEKTEVESGGSVELKFTANLKTSAEGTTDKGNIEAIAGNQKIDLLLDLSVLKTVKDSTGTTVTDGKQVTTLAKIIEIHLPIPANLQGKAGLSLYRMHDGKPEKLGEGVNNKNTDGEYYTIDSSGEFMTLYVKNFSTYAMGYNAFTVTVSDGGTGASGKGNYSNGDTVTINAGSKSGYSFNGWTVTAGTATLANASSASTTFTMPAENVTVTAGWTYTGGGNPGGGGSTGGGGSDGGSTTTTYPNTAKQPENGTVTMTPASPTKGQTVTITTKPDAGYVVETILVKGADGKTIAATEKGANSYTFTQPACKVTVEVTYGKAQTGVSFTDVTANDWCYDAVMEATANGWFSGTSATTFCPKAPTTRGMIATILHRMEGTPQAIAASFGDVAADAYCANGVAWAQANGIVQGYANGNYGPNNKISREQLAAILYRYANFKGYDVSKTAALGSFADSKSVSGYAEEAMSWAVGCGILSGRDDNTLAPTATATRAEVATILVRFEKLFVK